MSALHAALLTRTLDELVAVSVLSSRFNSSPCPFEDGTIMNPDEPSLHDVLPPPLTLEQMEKMRDLVIPEGVVFTINGHLVVPGTLLPDAMDMFEDDNYEDYGYPEDDEEETCRGCIGGMKGGYYHSGPGGCLC